jgi:hypothetical protein
MRNNLSTHGDVSENNPTGRKDNDLAVLIFYNTLYVTGDVPFHFLVFQGIPYTI